MISGNTASRLEQVRALAADKNWDEAVDILRELSADSTDRVVALDGERFVSLPTYCQWELARLPADALAAYRRRVDALAEKWYREGVSNRDTAQLGRVVDELFCSTWGDDALLALGELALERGDYAAARRYWEQISPLTRDPNGKPLWLSLRGVDLDKHWPEIERRWPLRQQPPTLARLPGHGHRLGRPAWRDSRWSQSCAGELDRAALELDALRRWHPEATGRLGGQDGPYAAALEKLLAAAKEWPTQPPDINWPTFAGAQSRSPNAAPVGPFGKTAWANPIKLSANETTRPRIAVPFDPNQATQVRESDRALSYFPVIVNGLLLYADATTVSAASLATGKPAITPDGTLFRIEATAGDTNAAMLRSQYVAAGVPRFSLTVIEGIAYARVGPVTTARIQAAGPPPVRERLVGIDLKRDGLLAFQKSRMTKGWSFDGTPVGDGRRIYVAMRHGDVTPHAYVACFDVATGHRLWRTSVGSADTPAAGNGDDSPSSSSTSRNTPCVLGCCGPMLTVIVSVRTLAISFVSVSGTDHRDPATQRNQIVLCEQNKLCALCGSMAWTLRHHAFGLSCRSLSRLALNSSSVTCSGMNVCASLRTCTGIVLTQRVSFPIVGHHQPS